MARIYQYAIKLAEGGMGCFLNPPAHPSHRLHLTTSYGGTLASLGAITSDGDLFTGCVNVDEIRAEVESMLSAWESSKPPLHDPEVDDWVLRVLGYFRGCYRNPNAPERHQYDASSLVIDPKRDVIANADDHAGVRHIRKFYPEFVPHPRHVAEAYWGTKPTAK